MVTRPHAARYRDRTCFSLTLHLVKICYWHCPHSMRARLCVTVRCPSVVPIRPLQQRVSCLLLWARRVGDIDDCSTTGAAATRSSKCGLCHVYSWRRKLNTDLYCFRDSEVLVEKPGFFTFHPCLTPVNCDAVTTFPVRKLERGTAGSCGCDACLMNCLAGHTMQCE